jgi:hypothetical protein
MGSTSFHSICGEATPEHYKTVLEASARLTVGTFGLRKTMDVGSGEEKEGQFFVHQERVRVPMTPLQVREIAHTVALKALALKEELFR